MMDDNPLESLRILYQKTHIEALINNQKQVDKWQSYKADLNGVCDRLKLFLQDASVPIMVPIGNKALFRGRLVHTNDILMFLGDGYFAKGSVHHAVESAARKIVKCDEMLLNLGKERTLLESRTNIYARNNDLFPSEQNHEIIEEYVDDVEEKWNKEHRKKVKDYKQRISELKRDAPSEIKTEENLWKRLEILELEEELNDELDRLGDDEVGTSDEDISSNSTQRSSEDESEGDNSFQQSHSPPNLPSKAPRGSIMKHSHSFPKDKPSLIKETQSDDYIKINFKHSTIKPDIKQSNNSIDSPYDIYTKYSDAINKDHRKVTRRVSFANIPDVKIIKREEPTEHITQPHPEPIAFGDVIERTAPADVKLTESRPVSKFKSSRITPSRIN